MTIKEIIKKNSTIKNIDIMTGFGIVQCSVEQLNNKQIPCHLGCAGTDRYLRDFEYNQLITGQVERININDGTLHGIL